MQVCSHAGFFSLITKNFHIHFSDFDIGAYQAPVSEITCNIKIVNVNVAEAGFNTIRLKFIP